jgi:hypothetical protein
MLRVPFPSLCLLLCWCVLCVFRMLLVLFLPWMLLGTVFPTEADVFVVNFVLCKLLLLLFLLVYAIL